MSAQFANNFFFNQSFDFVNKLNSKLLEFAAIVNNCTFFFDSIVLPRLQTLSKESKQQLKEHIDKLTVSEKSLKSSKEESLAMRNLFNDACDKLIDGKLRKEGKIQVAQLQRQEMVILLAVGKIKQVLVAL